jgi:hypothetical protein
MKLNDYKTIFIAVALIGSLLIATPALSAVIQFPGASQFTELYMLGSTHQFSDYPYNITSGENYTVYLGIANHERTPIYYQLSVKFADNNASLPNVANGTCNPQNSLYETLFSLQAEEVFGQNFSFALLGAVFANNQSFVAAVNLNGYVLNVNSSSSFDPSSGGFHYWIIFELWIYNPQSGSMQYNNHFSTLQLNLKPL